MANLLFARLHDTENVENAKGRRPEGIIVPMLRRVFMGFALLLLLLSLLTAGMWVRSYWVLDVWSSVDQKGRITAVLSYRGGVHWLRTGARAVQRPLDWDRYRIPPESEWQDLYAPVQVRWQRLGFMHLVGSRPARGRPAPGVLAPPSKAELARMLRAMRGPDPGDLVPWLRVLPVESWVIPYWFPVVLFVLPVIPSLLRLVRGWNRRRLGLCPTCGYDLRASKDKCPECGTVIADWAGENVR